jgi:hypothetical protein
MAMLPYHIELFTLGFPRCDPLYGDNSKILVLEVEQGVPWNEQQSSLERVTSALQWLLQFHGELNEQAPVPTVLPTVFLAAFCPDLIYPYTVGRAEHRVRRSVHRSALTEVWVTSPISCCARAIQIQEVLKEIDASFSAFLKDPLAAELKVNAENNPVRDLRAVADAVNVDLAYQFVEGLREKLWHEPLITLAPLTAAPPPAPPEPVTVRTATPAPSAVPPATPAPQASRAQRQQKKTKLDSDGQQVISPPARRHWTAMQVAFVLWPGRGQELKRNWDRRRNFYPEANGWMTVQGGRAKTYDPRDVLQNAVAAGDVRPQDVPRILREFGLKPPTPKTEPSAKSNKVP